MKYPQSQMRTDTLIPFQLRVVKNWLCLLCQMVTKKFEISFMDLILSGSIDKLVFIFVKGIYPKSIVIMTNQNLGPTEENFGTRTLVRLLTQKIDSAKSLKAKAMSQKGTQKRKIRSALALPVSPPLLVTQGRIRSTLTLLIIPPLLH